MFNLLPNQLIEIVRRKGYKIVHFDVEQTCKDRHELLHELTNQKLLVVLLNEKMCEKDLNRNLFQVQKQISKEVST